MQVVQLMDLEDHTLPHPPAANGLTSAHGEASR